MINTIMMNSNTLQKNNKTNLSLHLNVFDYKSSRANKGDNAITLFDRTGVAGAVLQTAL